MRPRSPVLATLALAIAMLAPPAAAAGDPTPLRPFPHPAGDPELIGPRADGHRYLVHNLSAGSIGVFDTHAKRMRTVAVGQRCYAVDATRNAALVNCSDTIGPYVLDLRALVLWAPFGTRLREPGDDGTSSSSSYYRIGRHWMVGGYSAMAHGRTVFANWRTRRDLVDEHDDFAGIRDINSPELRAAPRYTWSTFVSEGPYVLRDAFTKLRDGNVSVRLVLRRGGRSTTLGPGADSPSLSAGLVSWRSRRAAHVYDPRTRTRHTWRLPGAPEHASVMHTDRYVFAEIRRPDGRRVLWARIPGT